jgi:hypothetical protein
MSLHFVGARDFGMRARLIITKNAEPGELPSLGVLFLFHHLTGQDSHSFCHSN